MKGQYMKNMNLRVKLFLSFGFIVLLLLQNGAFTVFQLNQFSAILPKISTSEVQRHLAQSQVIVMMMTALGLVLAIMLTFFMARSIFGPLAEICKSLSDAVDRMGENSEKETLEGLVKELRRVLGVK